MILIGSTTLLIMSILFCIFAKPIANRCTSPSTDTADIVISGVIGIVLSIFVGFLLLGTIASVGTKKIQIEDYNFIEGKYYYMIETPDELVELDDGKIINSMVKYDDPLLYKIMKLDSYGNTLRREYIVKPREGKEKKE